MDAQLYRGLQTSLLFGHRKRRHVRAKELASRHLHRRGVARETRHCDPDRYRGRQPNQICRLRLQRRSLETVGGGAKLAPPGSTPALKLASEIRNGTGRSNRHLTPLDSNSPANSLKFNRIASIK